MFENNIQAPLFFVFSLKRMSLCQEGRASAYLAPASLHQIPAPDTRLQDHSPAHQIPPPNPPPDHTSAPLHQRESSGLKSGAKKLCSISIDQTDQWDRQLNFSCILIKRRRKNIFVTQI